MKLIIKALLIFTIIIKSSISLKAAELSKIRCNKENIKVEILLTKHDINTTEVFLKNIYDDSFNGCQPKYHESYVTFQIDLKEFYKCGLTRSINKLKDQATYYQTIILKQNYTSISTFNIKCTYKISNLHQKSKPKLVKRDALPNDFKEVDDVEILETIQEQAPQPQVQMEVRQNEQLIDGMVTVIPGTPLVMKIKLNEEASTIYGLNVNYLEVSDTRDMSETIIFRGCTVDPYLFENFNITESHTLKSKFRAFKFPNTSFVQFRANVQICLKKCPDPLCGNNQQGQNRRKREVLDNNSYLHEISLNLLLKIDDSIKGNEDMFSKLQQHVKLLSYKNLALRNSN